MSATLRLAARDMIRREAPAIVGATGLIFRELGRTSSLHTLGSVLSSYRGGVWGEEAATGCGYPVLRSTNMRGMRADVHDVAWREVPVAQAQGCALATGDILVTKSSGSSDLVGKATIFTHPDDGKEYLFSNFVLRLRPDSSKVLPEYVAWFLRSPQALAWRYEAQQNAVGLRNLQTAEFLNQSLPVPDEQTQRAVVSYFDALEANGLESASHWLPGFLAEQRRIVARIEELAAKIEEAKGLRQEVKNECEMLCRSLLNDSTYGSSVPTPMRELVVLRDTDVSVEQDRKYSFAGIYSFGKGMFQGQEKTGMEFAYSRLTRLHTGNFVYPKLMAWEGAFSVVPPECDGSVVSPEFPVFEVNEDKVLPEVLDVYFRTPAIWSQISAISTGTNLRRRRLQPSAFLGFEFPLPPMKAQRRFIEVKKRTDAIQRLQEETSAELDAMLPAVLDRAFRGEL